MMDAIMVGFGEMTMHPSPRDIRSVKPTHWRVQASVQTGS